MSDTPRTDALDVGDATFGEMEIWTLARQLERELAEARGELERCRVQLAGCGVIAGCNTRQSLSEQLPTPDSYGYSASLLDVAKAVTREMSERERAEKDEAKVAALKAALLTVLDQVDYTVGACSITNMVGACLPADVITMARAAIDAAKQKP